MRRSPRCLPLAVLATLALSACGGGSVGPAATNPTASAPTASAPDATAPPTDATQPGTAPLTTPTTTAPAQTQTPTRTQPSDTNPAGGSQSVRVPASFVVTTSGRLTPPTITVPPFLAVEISLRSADGRAHTLVVQTPTPHTLQIAAGARAQVRIAGLRAGTYAVTLDGRRAGALVAGGDAGP